MLTNHGRNGNIAGNAEPVFGPENSYLGRLSKKTLVSENPRDQDPQQQITAECCGHGRRRGILHPGFEDEPQGFPDVVVVNNDCDLGQHFKGDCPRQETPTSMNDIHDGGEGFRVPILSADVIEALKVDFGSFDPFTR